ncbi:MAG: NAD(P)/FAD-dependent oxidoreductase [Gammaproteobacteria bacterium]
MQYDAIVVGGGQAGSACAYDLASAGLSVLLLDRREFPRFKACAGGVTTKALRRYRFSIAPAIRQVESDLRVSMYLKRETTLQAPAPICAMTVRTDLDELCFRQALAAGARYEQIGPIRAIDEGADAVTLTLEDGRVLRARYLVGADGAHSQVRKLTGGFVPDRTAVAMEGIVRLPAGTALPPMTFDFGVAGQGYGWLFPKGDHVNVGIYTRRPEEVAFNKELLREYVQRRLGLGADAIEHLVGFPIGTGGEHYQPRSERVMLVGDAGGMAEALLGEGIYNAVLTGQMAASAIVLALANNANARQLFDEYSQIVRGDLANCRQLAQLFYKFLPISYGLLRHVVADTLVNGFAAGMTTTGCKRAFFTRKPRFDFTPPLSLLAREPLGREPGRKGIA